LCDEHCAEVAPVLREFRKYTFQQQQEEFHCSSPRDFSKKIPSLDCELSEGDFSKGSS
jgi:hypothetical protein